MSPTKTATHSYVCLVFLILAAIPHKGTLTTDDGSVARRPPIEHVEESDAKRVWANLQTDAARTPSLADIVVAYATVQGNYIIRYAHCK